MKTKEINPTKEINESISLIRSRVPGVKNAALLGAVMAYTTNRVEMDFLQTDISKTYTANAFAYFRSADTEVFNNRLATALVITFLEELKNFTNGEDKFIGKEGELSQVDIDNHVAMEINKWRDGISPAPYYDNYVQMLTHVKESVTEKAYRSVFVRQFLMPSKKGVFKLDNVLLSSVIANFVQSIPEYILEKLYISEESLVDVFEVFVLVD